jgi:hypothetical protein
MGPYSRLLVLQGRHMLLVTGSMLCSLPHLLTLISVYHGITLPHYKSHVSQRVQLSGLMNADILD